MGTELCLLEFIFYQEKSEAQAKATPVEALVLPQAATKAWGPNLLLATGFLHSWPFVSLFRVASRRAAASEGLSQSAGSWSMWQGVFSGGAVPRPMELQRFWRATFDATDNLQWAIDPTCGKQQSGWSPWFKKAFGRSS